MEGANKQMVLWKVAVELKNWKEKVDFYVSPHVKGKMKGIQVLYKIRWYRGKTRPYKECKEEFYYARLWNCFKII